MDMDRLQTLNGKTFSSNEAYSNQIEYLAQQFGAYEGAVQFFASTPAQASLCGRFILEHFKHLELIGD